MSLAPSAHIDTFARDHLPDESLWPTLEFTIADVRYPERLNASVELLDRTIDTYGRDRTAFSTPAGEVWSYGELADQVNRIANLLVEKYGIVPGNRVMLRMPNAPLTAAFWLATLRVGAVVVTTMTAWKCAELTKIIPAIQPSLIVVDYRFAEELEELEGAHAPFAIVGGDVDEVLRELPVQSTVFVAVDTAADDVALMAPTSGTTGKPKVTMHFHRDILANADTFAKHTLAITKDDVVAGSPPLAFTFGLGGLVIFPLRFGASAVLIERASPLALADAIDQFGVTMLYTAPTGYRTMLKEGRAGSLGKLRVGISAGEHLPLATFEAVERESGIRLIDGIGSTEMLHVFISAPKDGILPGATGQPVPGFRAAILDAEGNELGDGEVGLLGVIGPTGCRYLDDPRQSNYVVNGWNVTGDTYVRDAQGFYHYQARADDMIIAAGYNVGGAEVQEIIDTHPHVLESAVVGRPDPEKGFIVNAFVVPRQDVEATQELGESIIEFTRSRLAMYKTPRRVDFIDALPRNASGKVQLFVLRDRATASVAEELTSTERSEGAL